MIKITCIIPTLNEERNIKNLISSIKNQTLPHEIGVSEIIVVDNGSNDKTTMIANNMGASVYIKPQFTIGGLRNYGAKKATGELLLFLDADNILTENVINSLARMILNKEVGAIGVQLRPYQKCSWVPRTWYYHLSPEEPGYYNKESIASGAFIIRKNVFFEVGGFNAALDIGEDTDLSRAISKKGYKIILDAQSIIYNTGFPEDLLAFMKREFWHGDSWQTILVHKKIDSLTIYLIINVLMFLIIFIRAQRRLLRMLTFSLIYIVLPSIIKAYNKRKKIDILFFQLLIIYLVYILSRTISLFKVNIKAYLVAVKMKK